MTKAGAVVRTDAVRLWRQGAERLAGAPNDGFARTAASLVLVAAAGGQVDEAQLAAVLTAAGWSGRGRTDVHPDVVTGAGHVDEVLW